MGNLVHRQIACAIFALCFLSIHTTAAPFGSPRMSRSKSFSATPNFRLTKMIAAPANMSPERFTSCDADFGVLD